MNQFFNTVVNTPNTVTTNGMAAHSTTLNPILDLFYAGGASRGQNIEHLFQKAFDFDADLAGRVLLWIRDCRGGAGERETFRDGFSWLCTNHPDLGIEMAHMVPLVGRWDDLLAANDTPAFFRAVIPLISVAMAQNDALCAKWMPRKGMVAAKIRRALGLTPKAYRKRIVGLSRTVEQQMCAGKWDEINFGHVPSVAAARYQKAFGRNCSHYAEYRAKLTAGAAKINAGAIFPHDVLRGALADVVQAQWDAMPIPAGISNCLPIVDVSGSMWMFSSDPHPGDVAVALGMFIADKIEGPFKKLVMTFDEKPKWVFLNEPTILENGTMLRKAPWGGSTNISNALQLIVDTAVAGQVPAADIPKTLLILSDMQFDSCAEGASIRAIDKAKALFAQHGYECPAIVFWNLNGSSNAPVQRHESGAMLVSGYSPAIMSAIMEADLNSITPTGLMMQAIMKPKYNWRW